MEQAGPASLTSTAIPSSTSGLLQKEIRSAIKCLETALEDMVSVVKMSLLG